MWEKSRGVPLGLERVEAEPFENGSECSGHILSSSLFLLQKRFLKGPLKSANKVSRFQVLENITGPREFA